MLAEEESAMGFRETIVAMYQATKGMIKAAFTSPFASYREPG